MNYYSGFFSAAAATVGRSNLRLKMFLNLISLSRKFAVALK